MNLTEIFRRFLRNAAMILGSRLTFGLVNLGTNALIVRAFGLTELGIVLLLQVYVRLFTDIVKFDSWQAVLTFGAREQEAGNPDRLRRLLGFTLGVDVVSVSLGVICAILFVPWAADIFEWPPEVTGFAPIFALSVFFLVQGTPNGILRLVDRVDILAIQFALNATIRFLGVGAVALLGGGVYGIALAWFAANVLSGVLPMIFAWREARARGMVPCFDIGWHRIGRHFEGIWKFLVFSNLSSSLSFIYFSGTVTFVGGAVGPAAAATLQIAQQFAVSLSRPARILSPLISPELAKLAATGDWATFARLIQRQLLVMAAVLTVFGAVLFLVLGFIVETVYGPELSADIRLFQILILASLLVMTTFSFEPAMLSANKPAMLLSLRAGAALIYVASSLALLPSQGIYAFGYGFLISQTAYVVTFATIGTRILRDRVREQIRA